MLEHTGTVLGIVASLLIIINQIPHLLEKVGVETDREDGSDGGEAEELPPEDDDRYSVYFG